MLTRLRSCIAYTLPRLPRLRLAKNPITLSLLLATPLFILLTPFIYFVKFNAVPLGHPEFFFLLATLFLSSLLVSALLWRASWIKTILVLACTITFSFSFLPEFQTGLALKIIFFGMLILAILLDKKTLPLFAMMTGAFCLATLIFPVGKQFNTVQVSAKTAKSNNNLPLYIHIIFDEHMGVNAIPTTIKGGKELQDQIKTFYLHYGFRVYTNAYSRYSRTYDSIPNELNFIPQAQDSYYFPGGFSKQILTQNKDFQLLSKMGYKIRVYQPNYIDFCHAKKTNYTFCYSYPVYSLHLFYQLPFSWQERYLYLLKSYLFSSSIYQNALYEYVFTVDPLAEKIGIHLPHWTWDQNQLSTLATLNVMKQLKEDVLQKGTNGTAFFAHILLPHSPYLYNASCQIQSKPMDWLINYDFGPTGNTDERRVQRYHLYNEQMQCLYLQLQTIFSAWRKAGVLKNAVIIVQGDHSSRLPVRAPTIENKGQNNWQDFQDAYPALFAIKAPGYTVGIDEAQLPTTYLFGQAMKRLSGQAFPVDTDRGYVYLTDAIPGLREEQLEESVAAFKR